jgi:aspartyl-tRNA(Asn)/glutamyl-tRNA(Gln) amidotransferase subunit C
MIGKEDIDKLADLARIEIPLEEKDSFVHDIDAILNYVGQVNTVSGISHEPDQNPTHRNIMREDEAPHESGIYTDAILQGAPEKDGKYIKVKKIL